MLKIYYDNDADLDVLKDKTIAIIGYGIQGRGQALNLKDSGVNVIVSELEGTENYEQAKKDGFDPVDAKVASEKADIIQVLTQDHVQASLYANSIAGAMGAGKSLVYSHGINIHYNEIVPPADVDVILVAPKGSGTSVRRNFLNGAGINSSYAVEQDATGRAEERCLAVGIAIGSGYLFPTTFQSEVYSDLTGERGILMGALAGVMEAQYDVLRKNGHSPSEAFNETVEELTQSLIRLVDENGMDWMFANCSATAQRGALDWRKKFKKATLPVFKDLYKSVKDGKETARVIRSCSGKNYKEKLDKELSVIGNSEMWQTGKAVRALRPKSKARAITKDTKGVKGRGKN